LWGLLWRLLYRMYQGLYLMGVVKKEGEEWGRVFMGSRCLSLDEYDPVEIFSGLR
jgi:hypothetical protein